MRGSILEIGAGTGLITTSLAEWTPVFALEPSAGMRAILLSRLSSRPELLDRVTVLPCDALSVTLDKPVEAVVMINVMYALEPDYRKQLGATDPVVTTNLRWLAGYRHSRHRLPDIAAALLAVVAGPTPLMVAAEQVGDPVAVLPVLFHLLWCQELVVDLRTPLHDRTSVLGGASIDAGRTPVGAGERGVAAPMLRLAGWASSLLQEFQHGLRQTVADELQV